MAPRHLQVLSWNVNGLRAIAAKGTLLGHLEAERPFVLGLQETRCRPDQLPTELVATTTTAAPHVHLTAAERAGYSGVGAITARAPDDVTDSLGDPAFDREGRFQELRFGALTIVNAYFPNGNGSLLPNGQRSNDRIPYKLAFYRHLFDRLEAARRAGERILVMGDFNTAHQPIDLARPRENAKTSGFTEIERAELGRWLAAGWTDTYRAAYPEATGAYSWWSQRFGIRAKNIGWRLDLVLASPGVLPFIRKAFIRPDVMGSDHCPVGVTLDPKVLRP